MQLVMRIIFIFSAICTFAIAQHLDNVVDDISSHFKSFEYSDVIIIADSILLQDSSLSSANLIEINRMKALSHFVLGEEHFSKNCFNEILKIDPKFKLDPVLNSPKIISFFNQVKLDYLQAQIILRENQSLVEQNIDQSTITKFSNQQNAMKGAMIKSILLPGWGHLHLDRKKPGILLMTGTLTTLPPMLYYIFNSNNKEKEYLNATDFDEIQTKYDSYNESYQIRNVFIAGFTIVWLYSQWDLFSENSQQQKIHIQPGLAKDRQDQIIWTVKFTHHF